MKILILALLFSASASAHVLKAVNDIRISADTSNTAIKVSGGVVVHETYRNEKLKCNLEHNVFAAERIVFAGAEFKVLDNSFGTASYQYSADEIRQQIKDTLGLDYPAEMTILEMQKKAMQDYGIFFPNMIYLSSVKVFSKRSENTHELICTSTIPYQLNELMNRLVIFKSDLQPISDL